MRTRSASLLFATVLATLLAACADPSGEPGTTPAPTPSAGSTPVPGPTPSLPSRPPVSPPVVPGPSDRPGLVTLTGEVYAGVEPGCKLLAAGSGDYLLIGTAAESLPFGDTVTVRGQVRADMATTCQQGIPFEVTEVVD